MQDRYGREVTDLRISLTQRCNLRCVFCHMEGQPVSREELTAAEIEDAVRGAALAGIRRVKLTGGEPTLRTDLPEIVSRIRPHVEELSMTTNGLKLVELAPTLRAAGLDRVNVSVPSLDREEYRSLTGVDGLDRTLAGIRAAIAAGLAPVKLNVVALERSNGKESPVSSVVRFAQSVGAWVQVIEFENVSGRVDPLVYRDLHSELGRLTADAASRAFRVDHNRLHDRPRYTLEFDGAPAVVEVVQPVENPAFCMACHRLRLTSDGRLKGCLMTNAGLVDLYPALRAHASPEELLPSFEEAIRRRRPFFVGPETPTPLAEGALGAAALVPGEARNLPMVNG
ncbi:MAG: GTP 3',8-cyclase MoaA [Thermoplasmata archaeon]|nr:GTP 3',8-cyclase MoaA [Thermoplasmata archaeon]